MAGTEFTSAESAVLARYFTNMDRPVFALRNLPEVVKGALFSRYSRTEKSLRRVLLDEFINEPDSGFEALTGNSTDSDDMVAVRRAEEFYERVLVGYGDDSVAELAGAIRARFPIESGETDRAWKSATRAKALDLLRGLLPAGALTNLGLFGNGRAFEYLITKLAAHELPECQRLATDLHRELALVIPAFVTRALAARYGAPSPQRTRRLRKA